MHVVPFPTTRASHGATGHIAPTPTPRDPIQLHAEAHNALAMAVFYLRQPHANVPGAARKAVQALAALRRMDAGASNAPTHQLQGGAV